MTRPKPIALLILDGWGVAPAGVGNPLVAAATPVIDALINEYPTMMLRASGESVGLSWGEMGNSEVGHLTIGAGRIFYQSLPRINLALGNGEFFANDGFLRTADHVRKNSSTMHIIGILSAGNVHGSDEHIYGLLRFAKEQGIGKVMVHVILDGRDAIYNSGIEFVRTLQEKCAEFGVGEIASVCGRYYAMDRDHRWDRTELAYSAMIGAVDARTAIDAITAIQKSYDQKVYDEEMMPVCITRRDAPVGAIHENDAIIFSNFRSDRARQLTEAFVMTDFSGFSRSQIKNLFFCTMTEYEKGYPVTVAFPPEEVETGLAKIISEAGLSQLHIAETEKYAHVTFFFNGMKESPYPGEDRVIIPSPRVASYDKFPEMSAEKITDAIVEDIKTGTHDFIVANFANADMVAHTGDFGATKVAVEVIDRCLGKIITAIEANNGVAVITADHGNAEEVVNLQTGAIDKEHSTNAVPCIVVGAQYRVHHDEKKGSEKIDLSFAPVVGMLADVAPTILKIMAIAQPPEMTGNSLI